MVTFSDRSYPQGRPGATENTETTEDPEEAADVFASAADLDPRTDDDLVQDFLAGDSRAFRIIVERHRSRLTHVARRYARTEGDAEDIMQEAWLKASASLDTFRAEAKLTTWLHRVVSNKGHDFLTHRSRRESAVLDDDEAPHQYSKQLIVDPYEQADHSMLVGHILSLLPEHQRTALILVDMLGHDLDTAARELGVRSGTLKSRRARARTALRERMGTDLP